MLLALLGAELRKAALDRFAKVGQLVDLLLPALGLGRATGATATAGLGSVGHERHLAATARTTGHGFHLLIYAYS